MFLHGIEEFQIVRGDTLASPAFLEYDELKKFNVILANPPYSIKSWDRKSFENDPYGRNLWGTPPQGCADYAFQQHIQKSLDLENGRSISLWPHGVLFRDKEAGIRGKMIEEDQVECVIGLGPNLFYNSPMEACLLITRTRKPKHKEGKILFINAVNEVRQEKTMGFLEPTHIDKIFNVYSKFEEEENFAALVSREDVLKNDGNMSVSLYVRADKYDEKQNLSFTEVYDGWEKSSQDLKTSMDQLFETLEN